MKLKSIYLLSLLSIGALAVSACNKQETDSSSVSTQEIQKSVTQENSNQYIAEDATANLQLIIDSEQAFRKLGEEELVNYNKQHTQSAVAYFYNDDNDVTMIVNTLGKLAKDKKTFLDNYEKIAKNVYPNADFKRSNQDDFIALNTFRDESTQTNNVCELALTPNKDLYSVCLISPKESIENLNKVIQNITFKPLESK